MSIRLRPLERLPAGRRVLIARNPTAGARDSAARVQQLATALEAEGFITEQFTEIPALLSAITAARQSGELRCVVAAGGDGTVAMVANNTPPDTPVAVLPLGTENLLAKYLEVSSNGEGPRQLARWISAGLAARLDAGMVNGRLFLVMVSCGFDAEVVRRVHSQRRGHIHHFTYAKPILDVVRSYSFPELRLYCAAQPHELSQPHEEAPATDRSREGPAAEQRARWAFVFNLPRYAAGLRFTPQASGTDGQLDVCTFRHGSVLHGLRYLAGVMAGWHQELSDFQLQRTQRLRIESDEDNVPYQCDGDPCGYLPIDVEVLPARVKLVVAPEWAREHGFAQHEFSTSQEQQG